MFTIRNVRDIVALKTFLDKPETKRVFVVGGGFIGIELRKICSWPEGRHAGGAVRSDPAAV